MSLPSLTPEEVRELPLADLVQRMDTVRETADRERSGSKWFTLMDQHHPYPRVADLMSTTIASALDETEGRRLADAAFRFLLQRDLLMVACGIGNTVIYGPNFHEGLWSSPAHRMKSAVLDQYGIVASRIALECFFDLLHIAHKGRRMDGRSKFKAFRQWVLEDGNPYKYFVGHIIQAFEFDRSHRQREVHGTSRFAQELLRLERPDHGERNVSLGLTNILLSVWDPLLQLMNGVQPNSIAVFVSCDEFATQYFDGRTEPAEFDEFLSRILMEKMT